MPTVSSGKVLVTGANGYVAFWVVEKLLAAGYEVRGTVRSESKAKHIRDYFKSHGDKLEIVIVEDITKVKFFWQIWWRCASSAHQRSFWLDLQCAHIDAGRRV